MKINAKMMVEALKNAAAEQGITYKELGEQLGFGLDRAKNVFAGRTPLAADDVLRILQDPRYSLSRLKQYLPYWQLQQETNKENKTEDIIDAINEETIMNSEKIQASIMATNYKKPLSEAARDVMNHYGWYALQAGWICSRKSNGDTTAYTPIAPSLPVAVQAMQQMKWIWLNDDAAFVDWRRTNGDKTGEEAAQYCENQLRSHILDPSSGFHIGDENFLELVTGSTVNDVQFTLTSDLLHDMEVIDEIIEHWTTYELSSEPNEYGIALNDIYRDKFDYLEATVMEMCAAHDELIDAAIEIDPETEHRYRTMISEGDYPYKGAALIDPILATHDRRGHLANPTPEDWASYNKLQGDL